MFWLLTMQQTLVEGAVERPFPETATSTSMCAWLKPSLASDISGKGLSTPPRTLWKIWH